MNAKLFKIYGLVISGICLLRVLTVSADDKVEVYSATEQGEEATEDSDDADDEESNVRPLRSEIRISRPDEAASRVADEEGHELVPGAERFLSKNHEKAQDFIIVPAKRGRSIASQDSGSMPSEAQSHRNLNAEVMEPSRPFTKADANLRASEYRHETIVPGHVAPTGKVAYGLRSEPTASVEIEPPLPQSAANVKTGVQEISLIVSDYGYFPSRIWVNQNVPVKIYLSTPSKATMCFMLDQWGLKKGISPGKIEEITFVPEQHGEYRFYCPVKSIEGRLMVREAPSSSEISSRGLASSESTLTAKVEEIEEEKPKAHNEPKNAAKLRSLLED